MIKLTNAEAIAFNSPTMADLMNDNERPFPVQEAFQLADLINQISTRIRVYHAKQKDIIEKCGGEIQKSGQVIYKEPKHQEAAAKQIADLNSIELEYSGSKLVMTCDWPKLTLAEASIMRPIIDMDTAAKKDKPCQTPPSKKSNK